MSASSWNRIPRVAHSAEFDWSNRFAALPEADTTLLAHGLGRSYGDVCLNEGGTLLRTRSMDHFIAFDRASGRLRAEAGVSLKDILDLVIPQGWFLPVTPGTRFVTLGGAIANDVHGKNHHVMGNFGHHVTDLELLRSDGRRLHCNREQNADWLYATIGGLGLTGLITWAEIQLVPISNPFMITENIRFRNLDGFWEQDAAVDAGWPYTVSWVDCAATGKQRGRGVFMVGQHAPVQPDLPSWKERAPTFPIDPPMSFINGVSLRAFNFAYYHRSLPKGVTLQHHVPFFYPLDGLLEWNRIYGRRGFYQYQCVLPPEASREGIDALLQRIAASRTGSFLAVLKMFGDIPSLGMMSFPRAGATLALDFPNLGDRTHALFAELDAVVRDCGGRLYPAKDARMSTEMFRLSCPRWQEFSAFIDPRFSSSFWRRVNGSE
ncbi:MAG: FAD-binding oxidoreductase [Gammaproteobacteria bacterium]|nr:FAD-binding oxidoreductase [Gammaproteobacteria bacterium]MCP5135952.1 FAD-binding oxidoreductase [Gammaproteobacteria bacterium]